MGLKSLKALLARNIQQGRNPKALAASVALGSVLGLFPIPGVATCMCLVAAMVLRLNAVVLQAVNYAVYPLQIGMLGVYFTLGNKWFGPVMAMPELNSSADVALRDLIAGLAGASQIALPVISAWLITGPLIGVILYGLVLSATTKMITAASRGASTRKRTGAPKGEKYA